MKNAVIALGLLASGSADDHQVRRRQLQRFENPSAASQLGYVHDGSTTQAGFAYPLLKCRGDCDTHLDCAADLICLERESGNAADPVPGCFGAPANNAVDYCVDPDDLLNNRLYNIHSSDDLYDVGLLGNCQGDCSSDLDCAGVLKCYERRSANADVRLPGCTGRFYSSSLDYCYNPTAIAANEVFYIGNNGVPSHVFPLSRCRGDCDSDSDCLGNLVCQERSSGEPVRGCIGVPFDDDTDYCVEPIAPRFFAECEAGCESDFDCTGDNHICMQRSRGRNANNPVFGCVGTPVDNVNYCIDYSNVPATQLFFRGDEDEQRGLLLRCDGDCDSSSDCAPGLKCHQRTSSSPVPGCTGIPDRYIDYCVPE